MVRVSILGLAVALVLAAAPARAQHADENAARSAGDAFGTNLGNEKVGIYTQIDVRGFNPVSAGNLRLEGLYIDFRTPPPPHMPSGSQVRVGLTAQSYPFPAPTGIVDFSLRPVGDKDYVTTLLSAGPHRAYDVEVDAGQVITPGKLGIAWAFSLKRDEDQPRDNQTAWQFAIAPRWRPTESIELRPYVSQFWRPKKKAVANVFAAGPVLPKEPDSINYDPYWSQSKLRGLMYGLVGRARLSPVWTAQGVLARMEVDDGGVISDLYLNTDANGLAATRRFSNQQPFQSDSTSGEARLTGLFAGKAFDQLVHVSLRGRDVSRDYGGSAQVNFANVPIGLFNAPLNEPVWNYGVQSRELIKQWSGSVSYLLAKRGLGNIGIGLQQVDYRKTVVTPGRPNSVTTDKPHFWNGSISATPWTRLVFYGAFTEGLEEAPVAPEVATNAAEAPPAIRTKQKEAGLRYIVTPKLRLVVGYFDISKPYFNLDANRTYRGLGVESHRGLEASLTGELFPGFNVVGGYVHMKPRVKGEAVDLGLIGPEPVGQPRDTVRLNFDYRRTPNSPYSFEGAVNYFGARPVSAKVFASLGGKQLQSDPFTTVDVGMRYRFSVDGHRSTLRVQALNVFDAERWVVALSGGLTINAPRRYAVSLATDF